MNKFDRSSNTTHFDDYTLGNTLVLVGAISNDDKQTVEASILEDDISCTILDDQTDISEDIIFHLIANKIYIVN